LPGARGRDPKTIRKYIARGLEPPAYGPRQAGREKPAPSATVVALQQAANEVAGVNAELKTVGSEPSGPVLTKVDRDIESAMGKIDAALALLAAHQNDEDVIAYAKTIQFPTVKALQDHLNITHIDLKWGREFNVLSQATNTPRSTIDRLSRMLDDDMVSLLNFPQTFSLTGLSCETPLGRPTLAVAIRVMTATHPNTRQFRPLGPCAISFPFPFRVGAD
jgi:hypothetical protein